MLLAEPYETFMQGSFTTPHKLVNWAVKCIGMGTAWSPTISPDVTPIIALQLLEQQRLLP